MRQPARPEAGTAEVARDRLLAAAAACFAARGYAGTSVRDITARANCNVGALTYHFGGKHKAYEAVFEERLAQLTERRVAAMRALLAGDAPELHTVVEAFAVAFLDPLQGSARGRETMTLLLREMVDGHLPASFVAERMVHPTLDALARAIDRACPGLDRSRLALCCHSLVSQLVHVLQVQRMHERGRLTGLPPFDVEATVRHIVCFTCAGVRACAAAPAPR
jgi:AcrR family transcriptional regulator